MAMAFRYRPLDQSSNEIRLIEITNLDALIELDDTIRAHPDIAGNAELRRSLEDDVPIRCTMCHISFDHDFTYAALSYMWGEKVGKRKMIIEVGDTDEELMITDNLNDALRSITLQGPWWIDAVCIDQSDNQEKSWQVQMMGDIFKKATRVLAWTGPTADNSDNLISQIEALPLRAARDTAGSSREDNIRYASWTPPEDSLDLIAFWHLLKRPYWRRAWVQQELQHTNPDAVMLYCGRQPVPSALVALAFQALHRKRMQLGAQGLGAIRRESYASYLSAFLSDEDVAQCASLLNGHVHVAMRDVKPSFAMLLAQQYVNYGKLKASDPRDLIYALLGMCSDSHRYRIEPAYAKTTAEVYIETSIALLRVHGARILVMTNFGILANPNPDLPSWVADWTQPFLLKLDTDASKSLGLSQHYPALGYSASRGLKDQRPRMGKHNYSLISLQLSGIRVDLVAEVAEPMLRISAAPMEQLLADQDPNFRLQLSWLEQLEKLSERCGNTYGNDQGVADAIWRVSITNAEKRQRHFYKASDTMHEGYRIFRSGYLRATIPAHEYYNQQRQVKLKLGGDYWLTLIHRSGGRKFFVTDGGFLGLGPPTTQKGDVVTIIAPLNCPIVLRPKGQCFQWLGESYVHGMMDGEVGDCADESMLEEFTIV